MKIEITIYVVISAYYNGEPCRENRISKTKTMWETYRAAQCYAKVEEAKFINHQDDVKKNQTHKVTVYQRTITTFSSIAARKLCQLTNEFDKPTTRNPKKELKIILKAWDEMGTDHRGRQLPSDLSRFDEALTAPLQQFC